MHHTERSRKFNIGDTVIVVPSKHDHDQYTIVDLGYTNGTYMCKLHFDDDVYIGWFSEKQLIKVDNNKKKVDKSINSRYNMQT